MQVNSGFILKILFAVHFFFSIFIVMDNIFRTGYLMTQMLIAVLYFIVFLGKDDSHLVLVLLGMTAMSLLTDSVFIGVFWDDYRALRVGQSSSLRARLDFEAAMAIILLILKVPMGIVHGLIFRQMNSLSNASPSGWQQNVNPPPPVNLPRPAENNYQ